MYATSPVGSPILAVRGSSAHWTIAAIPEDEMIVFTPDTVASIAVFTDVDCTYCRALHGDLEELMTYGIEVRYGLRRAGSDLLRQDDLRSGVRMIVNSP